MLKRIVRSFLLAFQNIRANLFHTLLSILGVVIGVGALVAILSLIDGLENMAHESISKRSSVESVMIRMNKFESVDGVRVQKENFQSISYEQFNELRKVLPVKEAMMIVGGTDLLTVNDSLRVGFRTLATNELVEKPELAAGRLIESEAYSSGLSEAVISYSAAVKLTDSIPERIIGDTLEIKDFNLIIVGVLDSAEQEGNTIAFPITLLNEEQISESNAVINFKAETVEQVPDVEKGIEAWLHEQFPDRSEDDYAIMTNEFWVKEINQGFLVFRVIMGLIIGISVLVGGIGIMNVLLISVNDRVKEIGIRKATGAKKRDIIWQFLAESIAISSFGSFLGALVGMGFAALAAPIARMFVEIPFQAAFTLNTLLVTGLVAIIIGVVFGTYPAIRASKLDPVEAIRKE